MLRLPPSGFYALLLIALCLLGIACIRVYRRRRREGYPRVRVRYYKPPKGERRASPGSGERCWVCPQCFQTSDQPGTCPNPDHDFTPVVLQPGDSALLEKYDEMRRLVNPDDE